MQYPFYPTQYSAQQAAMKQYTTQQAAYEFALQQVAAAADARLRIHRSKIAAGLGVGVGVLVGLGSGLGTAAGGGASVLNPLVVVLFSVLFVMPVFVYVLWATYWGYSAAAHAVLPPRDLATGLCQRLSRGAAWRYQQQELRLNMMLMLGQTRSASGTPLWVGG